MKKVVINILASIGIILLVLSGVATMYGGKAICINTIFEITALSAFMHLGFTVTHRFDMQYPVLEVLTDIIYTMVITPYMGCCFSLVSEYPYMGISAYGFVIYLVGYLIDLYRTKRRGQDDK